MKKLFILLALAAAVSCGDDEPAPGQLACEITAPADGAEVAPGAMLRIAGDARSEGGRIVKTSLRIDGSIVAEVTSVPFSVEHAVSDDRAEGALAIELRVEDDRGAVGSASVTVTVVRPTDPFTPVAGTMTDPRDGAEYRTVRLGAQLWMAENLRYLPAQHNDVSTDYPRYYVMFDHDAAGELGQGFLKEYGTYYNLPAALAGERTLQPGETRRVRGICPEGWHLPSQQEWNALAQFVLDAGMAAVGADGEIDPEAIAKALASKRMWIMPEYTDGEPQPTWVAVDMEKNDATLFDGLPVGFRACAGDEDWMHQCYSAGWWSSTAATVMDPSFGVPVRMWSDLHTFVTATEFNPGVGLPVRCLKD